MDTHRRALPFGAAYLHVFVAITEIGQPVTRAPAQFCGAFTKKPANVTFDAKDRGKTATYIARWASRRGEFGTWPPGASFTIAA